MKENISVYFNNKNWTISVKCDYSYYNNYQQYYIIYYSKLLEDHFKTCKFYRFLFQLRRIVWQFRRMRFKGWNLDFKVVRMIFSASLNCPFVRIKIRSCKNSETFMTLWPSTEKARMGRKMSSYRLWNRKLLL